MGPSLLTEGVVSIPLPAAREPDLYLVAVRTQRIPIPPPSLVTLGQESPPPSPAPVASDSPRCLRLLDWRSGGGVGVGAHAHRPTRALRLPPSLT